MYEARLRLERHFFLKIYSFFMFILDNRTSIPCAKQNQQVWERFHLYWLSSTVPVHVVRYEDLLARPERMLTDLVAFIHVRPLLENSNKKQNKNKSKKHERKSTRPPARLPTRPGAGRGSVGCAWVLHTERVPCVRGLRGMLELFIMQRGFCISGGSVGCTTSFVQTGLVTVSQAENKRTYYLV